MTTIRCGLPSIPSQPDANARAPLRCMKNVFLPPAGLSQGRDNSPRKKAISSRPIRCDDQSVAEVTSIGGVFWAADNPSVRVDGELIIEVGKGALARLTNNLRPDPRVTLFNGPGGRISGFAVSGLPERAVQSFQPITLRGQLDNGESVTLLDAQSHGAAGGSAPRYRSPIAVLGAWVSDDQTYKAVRFRMDRPYWLAHLTYGQSSEVEDDGSTLTVDASDGDNWLVYELSSPAKLRQVEMRVTSACLALLQLALSRTSHPRDADTNRTRRPMAVCAWRGNWHGTRQP